MILHEKEHNTIFEDLKLWYVLDTDIREIMAIQSTQKRILYEQIEPWSLFKFGIHIPFGLGHISI